MRLRLALLLGWTVGALMGLSACTPEGQRGQEGALTAINPTHLTVVATTSIVGDAARHLLAGVPVRLVTLMGGGVDPHLYKPSLQDARYLWQARILIASGLHLEGKMAHTLEQASQRTTLLHLADGIPDDRLRYLDEGRLVPDPHFWFDVSIYRLGVEKLTSSLSGLIPAHSGLIKQNGGRYITRLDSLDRAVAARIGRTPRNGRVLATSHDAFSYLGLRYGVDVRPLQGISTLAEFGLKDITRLTAELTNRRVKVIYPETSTPAQTVEAIEEGCRARGHQIRIGHAMYADALGPVGIGHDTYIAMIDYNITQLTQGW